MQIALLEHLRDEIRFDSREQLAAQIKTDIAYAQERFAAKQEEYNGKRVTFF